MLTASAFFLGEFPPLRGLAHFFSLLLLFLSLSGGARKREKKQQERKRVERRRREHEEVMRIKYSLKAGKAPDSQAPGTPAEEEDKWDQETNDRASVKQRTERL